jgi:predicted kinase
MALQCQGHLITEGMHPQYDLFKQWAVVKRPSLEDRLEDRYILFGEWAYARHSVHYRKLPHYFFEFDIYDKQAGAFLDLARRLPLIEGSGIQTVPVLHRGALNRERLLALIGPSQFDSKFENPLTKRTDDLMKGLYLRTEANGIVTCTVTMMSGLPGSGKDTWLATNRPDLPVVSLDGVRSELEIDPTDDQGEVVQLGRERCRQFFRSGRSFAFNATNLLKLTRQGWIGLFDDYQARIEVVYIEPPLSVILDQNKRRERPVPERVIRGLAARCEPPTITEAHGVRFGSGREE